MPREADPRHGQVQRLISAYGRMGGVVTGSELAALMQPHSDQAVSKVARWIVSRDALSFTWEAQTLLPLFQFESPTMRLRDGMAAVCKELADVFDQWELAEWFVTPNPWLGDEAPAGLLATRPEQLRDAARVDRYIARP